MTATRVIVDDLACPRCHGTLGAELQDVLTCETCAAEYPVVQGIPSFCETQEFYEEYLEEHCPFVRNPPTWKASVLRVLPYWSWREWRFFSAHVPEGARVLDLGCARGKEWFSSRASYIAGADPISEPLRDCASHYDRVVQAEITSLPFPDDSFDCVVTSHVIGHIPLEDKDAAFSEIHRVLRAGGVSVNIVETDSDHWFARLGKTDSRLYELNFIETDGHVGLEKPSALLARFERHGFRVEDVQKMESGHIHLRYYEKYLGKGYPERHPVVRRRIDRWRRIQRNRATLGAYEVFIGGYHRFVEPWRSRLDDAMFVAVSARKLSRDVGRGG
jgi:SAM-dependent methyltransferase